MGSQKQKIILLVVDETALLRAEAETLKQFGYEAITANTGEKAVEIVLSNKTINLVLMDINLGDGIDGPEAARRILEKRNIPIVFLTSHSEREYVDRVKEITHYGYVIKNSGDFVLRSSIEMAFELFEIHEKAREREESLLRAEIISGFGSWEFNLSTRLVNTSEGARRIYGLGDREWTIEEVQTIPLPEYRSMLDAAFLGLVEKGLPYNVEFEAMRPSDNKRISIHSMAKYDSVRNIVTGIIQDITERKCAEEELRHSEDKYRTLIETTDTGFVIIDKTGYVLDANPEYVRLTGHRDFSEIVGRSVLDWTADSEKEKNAEAIKVVSEKGYIRNLEIDYVDSKGNITPIEINATSIEIEGKIQTITICRDITSRKQAEKEILREKDKLKILSDNAPFGMVLIDQEGHFTYMNNKFSALFGYDLSDIPDGRTWLKKAYPDPEYRQTVVAASIEDLKDAKPGEHKSKVFTVVCKDGTKKIVQFITSILLSGDYLMTCEDITEMRQLENQLRQAQKTEAIGTLAGGIAHDFNNILTALMGYAALIQMKMDITDPLRPYVDEVLTASEKAVDLTQSLLAFSRQQSVTLVPLNMNNTIKVAEKLLRRLLTEDIEFHTTLGTGDMIVMADKSQMDQILFNLVTNARDAMPKGGRLTIETVLTTIDSAFIKVHGFGEAGDYVRISIVDTGEGMDEMTRQKIFDPFFTTKEIGKGTGLGLATVYGIIKQHNGYIIVESTLGQGSAFHVYLPQIKTKVDKPEERIIPLTRGKETVLIAEDNEGVRRFMREALQGQGYTIREAVDGEDAIEQFREHRDIDLIIIDSVMPKKNGRETYEAIHHIDPNIKALFTSGYTKDIVLDKGIEEKTFDFIAKPLSLNKLLQKVREVLDR